MHDCPGCGVPLHAHEAICPACGTRQPVRRGVFIPKGPPAHGINWTPVIFGMVIIVGGLLLAAQGSWVGGLLKQGPVAEDPMSKITFLQARDLIHDKIEQGLSDVGAKGKFTWKNGEAPADKNVDKPIELSIETALKDGEQQHKAIIDPIKDYMDKAKITTLTMTDSRKHATWTYTVQPAATPQPGGDDGSGASQ